MTIHYLFGDRRSGKTTKIIEIMQRNPELILVVPNSAWLNNYPRELHQRIKPISWWVHGSSRQKIIIEDANLIEDVYGEALLARHEVYIITQTPTNWRERMIMEQKGKIEFYSTESPFF